jgi:hypothetical protein
MPMQTWRGNSKRSISESISVINRFRQFGSVIRPLRGTFVYTALVFDKVGIRFELVGISQ